MYRMKYCVTKMNDTICILQPKFRYKRYITIQYKASIECEIKIECMHPLVCFRCWHLQVGRLECHQVRSVSGIYNNWCVNWCSINMNMISSVQLTPGMTDSSSPLVSDNQYICIHHKHDIICLAYCRDARFLISVGKW